MAHKIYREKQYYLSKIYFKIALAVVGLLAIAIVARLLFDPQLSLEPMLAITLIMAFVFLSGLLWFLHRLSLSITVSEKGINFKMKPFHTKKHKLRWQELKECKLIEDPYLMTWNTKRGTSWREKKFTFHGRTGLSITTQSGEKIFIGSKNLPKLKKAIDQGFAKYEQSA